MQRKDHSLSSRTRSFRYALQGMRHFLLREPNARIHLIATIGVFIMGVIVGLSPLRWLMIFSAITLVWITELLNTCIEILCDLHSDGKLHPTIKIIKDMAAAAVLIAALFSVAVGVYVFLF